MDKESVIDLLLKSGLWTNRDITRASVVLVRGYYLNSMGEKDVNDRGVYDDAVFVISPYCFESFNANTDPSRYRKGIATLVAPQRVMWEPGYHGYKSRWGHPAFRQHSDVTVTRDGKSGEFTDGEGDRFWINLHRGGRSTTSSAGCQTVHPDQWREFHSLVHAQLRRCNHIRFSGYLVEVSV